MKATVIEHRRQADFVYGSFTVYVKKYEIIIRGVLKKKHTMSKYMTINLRK